MLPICEGCQDAILEDSGDGVSLTQHQVIAAAVWMGDDIAPHHCERSPMCGCGCNQRYAVLRDAWLASLRS